jgi:outer membrane lipoprotein SlyB
MTASKTTGALLGALLIALGACSSTPRPADPYPGGSPPAGTTQGYPDAQPVRYGYVDAIETVPGSTMSGPGIGAIGGAIAGAVIGNQVGHGTGRAAATVGGAVLGGVAGHKVEEAVRGRYGASYRFRIRLDDGTYQTFTQEQHEDLRVGDRVRVENGRVWPT